MVAYGVFLLGHYKKDAIKRFLCNVIFNIGMFLRHKSKLHALTRKFIIPFEACNASESTIKVYRLSGVFNE